MNGLSTVTLDKVGITVVLNRLARQPSVEARALYGRLMSSWGQRPDRKRVSVKLAEPELRALKNLDLPGGILGSDVVPSPWWAIYRHPRNPKLEVRVGSKKKPSKRRTFKIGGKRVRLVAVEVSHNKEAVMATKTRKKKAVEEDELDELEGLEDLDDLDELEDEEEPEDEEDEDEDEEDEEPAPKRGRAKKAPAKKGKAKTTRKRRAEPEDEEDEEDEEEEPAPKRSKKASASKKSTKTKAKAKSNGGNLPGTRELPKGKVGPQEIAELVGGSCDARYVRIWLRESEYEREDGGRWAFGKQDARSIAKQIKADRRG